MTITENLSRLEVVLKVLRSKSMLWEHDVVSEAYDNIKYLLDTYNDLVKVSKTWEPKCGGCEDFRLTLDEFEEVE